LGTICTDVIRICSGKAGLREKWNLWKLLRFIIQIGLQFTEGSGMPRTEHCCFPLLFLSPLPHRAPPVLALVDLEEEES